MEQAKASPQDGRETGVLGARTAPNKKNGGRRRREEINTVRVETERGCRMSGVLVWTAQRRAEKQRWRALLQTAAAVLSFALQACGYSSLLSKGENI